MCENLRGRFYFKLTTNGNLLGEFSNNYTDRCWTETANRIGGQSSEFVGTFITTWFEKMQEKSITTKLVIRRKEGCEGIYEVVWRADINENSDRNPKFQGEAMLCDSILVGDYGVPVP